MSDKFYEFGIAAEGILGSQPFTKVRALFDAARLVFKPDPTPGSSAEIREQAISLIKEMADNLDENTVIPREAVLKTGSLMTGNRSDSIWLTRHAAEMNLRRIRGEQGFMRLLTHVNGSTRPN